MPWTRSGKCVYKKKADGSQGKKKGCSDSEEKAKKYMSKLYSLDETDLDETDPMFLGGGGAEEEEGVPMGELYLRNIIRRLLEAEDPAGPDTDPEPGSPRDAEDDVVTLNVSTEPKKEYDVEEPQWQAFRKKLSKPGGQERTPPNEFLIKKLDRRKARVPGQSDVVDAFRVVVDEIYDDPQVSAGMKNTFARITLSNFDEVMENFGARGAWSPEESGTIPPWAVPFYPIGQAREAEGAAGNQIGLGELAMRICYSNLEFEPKASARTDLVADGSISVHVKSTSGTKSEVDFYNISLSNQIVSEETTLEKFRDSLTSNAGLSVAEADPLAKVTHELFTDSKKQFGKTNLTRNMLKDETAQQVLWSLSEEKRVTVWYALWAPLNTLARRFIKDEDANRSVGGICIITPSGAWTYADSSRWYYKAQSNSNKDGKFQKSAPSADGAATSPVRPMEDWKEGGTSEQRHDAKIKARREAMNALWAEAGPLYNADQWKADSMTLWDELGGADSDVNKKKVIAKLSRNKGFLTWLNKIGRVGSTISGAGLWVIRHLMSNNDLAKSAMNSNSKVATLFVNQFLANNSPAWREVDASNEIKQYAKSQVRLMETRRYARSQVGLLKERLLIEDFTGSDRSEIKRMIKKEIEGTANKREIEKAFNKKFDKELKKALGTSFLGTPGKINKFVVDQIYDEVNKWLADTATRNEIAEITKQVIIKLYRELSFSSPTIINRIKI